MVTVCLLQIHGGMYHFWNVRSLFGFIKAEEELHIVNKPFYLERLLNGIEVTNESSCEALGE